jgi:type IV pilus assembly protein PilA
MFSSAIQRLDDRRHAAGEAGEDAGFTLIELMVVLLILAILLAIAIPTFLGVTKSANDRAAQSNLNTALVNAKAYYQNQSQNYTTSALAVTALTSAEPSIQFTTGNSTSQSQVSVFVPSLTTGTAGTGVILAGLSKNGSNCWYVVDNTVQQTIADVPYSTLNGYALTGPPVFNPTLPGTYYGVQKNSSTCSAGTIVAIGTGNVFQGNGFPASP